jgi:hypothetical protein
VRRIAFEACKHWLEMLTLKTERPRLPGAAVGSAKLSLSREDYFFFFAGAFLAAFLATFLVAFFIDRFSLTSNLRSLIAV